MQTSPDRADVEYVMAFTDVSGLETAEERNAARQANVEKFLDDDTTYNLDERTGLNGVSLRNMILSDLSSYPQWEES